MNLPIRFASINIEHNKHYERVFPFLKKFRPDVVCFQEIHERDLKLFETELQMKSVFSPVIIINSNLDNESSPLTNSGVAIFSNLPIQETKAEYYVGNVGDLPRYKKELIGGIDIIVSPINGVLLSAIVRMNEMNYRFATTHFTWSMNGDASQEQRDDLNKLFSVLNKIPDFILSGDFNAPRGREIWEKIASKYKDNIPQKYKTSIDKNLHRAGDLGLLVDGLFTTPEYMATDVKLTDGVSDHMAITAVVSRSARGD